MLCAALGFQALPESYLSDTKILTHKKSIQGQQGSRKHWPLTVCPWKYWNRRSRRKETAHFAASGSRVPTVEMPTQQSGFESLKTGPRGTLPH